MAKKNTTREFSYKRPIILGGSYYPSAESNISDENGNSRKGIIFTDANGDYYTLDSNHNAVPVMSKYDLEDVVINAQDKREPLLFNKYLTRNDKTQVNNLPHREYNTSLKANAKRGAIEHALWDREHPNLASWRDATTAIPFAVASAPLVLGTSQGLMGTALGQAAKHGIAAIMESPYVAGINDVIGLGFAGKGSYDVSQGKFTPETALDFLGGAGLMYKGLNAWDKASMAKMAARNASRRIVENSELGNNTRRGLEDVNLTRDNILVPETPEIHSPLIEANPTTPSLPASTQEMNVPARLLSDYEDSINIGRESQQTPARDNSFYDNLVADARIQGMNDPAIQELNAMADSRSRSVQPDVRFDDEGNPFLEGTIDNAPVGYNPLNTATRSAIDDTELPFDPVTGANNPNYVSGIPSKTLIKARNVKAGEAPYTPEEVNSWIDPNTGRLKQDIEFNADDEVYTGAHGEVFMPDWHPEQQDPTWILRQHIKADKNARKEMLSILKDNPTGRSGILIKTHGGDTSMDSTPLAYKMATRLGKNFKEMTSLFNRRTVRSNQFGYNNAFRQGYSAELERARKVFENNPNYKATLLRDSNGNMTAFELSDENGTFQIPLNSRQEVLDIMNNDLHKFNEHFGTSYSDITPYSSRRAGEHWDGIRTFYKDVTPETMYPWDFGEEFELPNIYGIAYKKGGKIKRRLLTQL